MDTPAIRRRKRSILILGVVLSFLTSMSKVLVPGTIFDQLQMDLGLDARYVSMFGSYYMYSYAASQLLIGLYANRLGGVRILLLGAGCFSVGTLGFASLSWYPPMAFCRLLCGFGAGIVFVGLTCLLIDLYAGKFTLFLSLVLTIGYLGPVFGTMPMVALVESLGWRRAMAVPGMAAFALLVGFLCFARGSLKHELKAESPWTPLGNIVRIPAMHFLCIASALVYGAYYVLPMQIGQKSLSDVFGLSPKMASTCMMLLCIVVAINTVAVNVYLKLLGGRRKALTVLGIALAFAGAILGYAGFRWKLGVVPQETAYLLICVPAGFFALFCTIVKELNRPEDTALACAILNALAFVFIALSQNVVGFILKANQRQATLTPSGFLFQADAYASVFLFVSALLGVSLLCALFIPEMRTRE
ncbi:MAG: MFS transporter [Victivallales bacterium]|nr:MFS transporter [Victivallales bacterium]